MTLWVVQRLLFFCNAPDDNPFMAGAFLGVTEADTIINVGVSGPGVVKKAIEKVTWEKVLKYSVRQLRRQRLRLPE